MPGPAVLSSFSSLLILRNTASLEGSNKRTSNTLDGRCVVALFILPATNAYLLAASNTHVNKTDKANSPPIHFVSQALRTVLVVPACRDIVAHIALANCCSSVARALRLGTHPAPHCVGFFLTGGTKKSRRSQIGNVGAQVTNPQNTHRSERSTS